MGDLQAFDNTGSYYAYGINNSGQIVGYGHSGNFLYSGGTAITFGSLSSVPYGINNSGQVVGSGYNNHAFLYSGGTMSDLGTLGGDNVSYGYGINNSGQVVANSRYSGAGGASHAFLYIWGTLMDLNSLITTNPGFTLQYAQAINDNLQIVGFGDGHASLLTPVRNMPPVISSQPENVTKNAGGNAVFTVSATGNT